jgi:DNA-binding MarR family transcriptional regulator
MNPARARTSARAILTVVPLVMRTVAAELRAAGELPAPAHFGLLSMLASKPRPLTMTELASLHGVSLPTMSNSISALAGRGWVHRTAPSEDRRQVRIEVTAAGRAIVRRVGRSAQRHLAALLTPLDAASLDRLQAGLEVLLQTLSARPDARRRRAGRRAAPTSAGG